ncbi:MAG TPA: Gfo/Idh/MocA family oxidoreductase [Pseudolabrys sp.]
MLRGAFIGFGNVAAKGHLPGWQSVKDVRIVAAADAVAAQGRAFLEACPGGQWHKTVDELLSDKALDFVDICTPPSSHAALIKRALDARLHVLCEKPLATRIEDAQAITAAAAGSGRVVHTVHNWLKAPICDRISALVDEGAVGTVRTVRWQTLRTEPAVTVTSDGTNWRADPAVAGGGILFDHGWHALYCVVRWLGVPRAVSALLEKRRFREWPIEDTATVTLDRENGSAQIYLTWSAEERANHIAVEGDRGRIEVADDVVVLKSNKDEQRWSCPPPLSQGSHHRDWFVGVAEDFQRAAVGGGKGNLDEALLCAQLIDLAQRSSAAGGARMPLDG